MPPSFQLGWGSRLLKKKKKNIAYYNFSSHLIEYAAHGNWGHTAMKTEKKSGLNNIARGCAGVNIYCTDWGITSRYIHRQNATRLSFKFHLPYFCGCRGRKHESTTAYFHQRTPISNGLVISQHSSADGRGEGTETNRGRRRRRRRRRRENTSTFLRLIYVILLH